MNSTNIPTSYKMVFNLFFTRTCAFVATLMSLRGFVHTNAIHFITMPSIVYAYSNSAYQHATT